MNEYETKLKLALKGRFVVYIDAANLEQSVKGMFVRPDDVPEDKKHFQVESLRWMVDYQKTSDFFRSLEMFQQLKFYTPEFDNDGHIKFRYFLNKGLGFKLETKPLKEYRDHTEEKPHRKANFDVEIATDAIFHMDSYDTLILFSGDCDFEYLIKFLRGRGKVIIGFSRSGHIAKELPPALSHYFDIANFRSTFLRVGLKAKDPELFDPESRN